MSRRPPPSLSKAAREALPIIEGGLSRGLSADTIQATLSAQGMGVRRTDLLQAIRSLRGISEASGRLRFISGATYPDPDQLPSAFTRQLREYSYKVKVSGINVITGQSEDRWFNISSNDNMTRDEIEEMALNHSINAEHYEDFDPEEVTLMSGTRR